MQNKNIKQLLLKSIIDSDFLLLDKQLTKSLRYTKSISNINDSVLFSLDPIETLKSIKQLIRLLQFFKKQNNKFLHILVENKQYAKIIESFFFKKKLNLSYSIKDSLNRETLPAITNQFLFLLTQPLHNNKQLIKKIFDKHIFLVNKVNAKLETNNWGTYKIFNDLNDFKKLIFLLILLDKVFNTDK
jgi:hypothetical protein